MRTPIRTAGRPGTARVAGATLRLQTFAVEAPHDTPGAVRAFYDDVTAAVGASGGLLLHEKTFGDLAFAAVIDDARSAAFAARGLPAPVPGTFIEGRPCVGGGLAGVQIWTVQVSEAVHCSRVDAGPGVGAVRVDTAAGRILFLSGVTGRPAAGSPPAGVAAEFRALFDHADLLLRDQGFTFADVPRTWIFVARLLDAYDDLNRARSAFFQGRGLLRDDPDAFLPASTGIQGRNRAGTECLMDVLAVAGRDAAGSLLRPIRSPRQDSAYRYGSAFSRGMRVGTGEAPLLLVSGTASIDRQGLTTDVGDRAGQIAETYRNVAAVLEPEGAGMDDVAMAIRYFKDDACWRAHREMADRGLLPHLPAIDVLADVCRDDLLFEMEATAGRRTEERLQGGGAPPSGGRSATQRNPHR